MINRLILPLSFYRGNSKQRTQNLSKTLKKPLLRQIYINFIFLFCFVLVQRKSEERDFRFGQREK